MALWDFLFGSKDKLKKESILTSQQQNALQSILGQFNPEQANLMGNPLYQSGSSYLQNLLQGGPGAFDQFEAPYLRQFNEEIAPALAERFTAGDAQRSSAFNNAFAKESSNLSQNLASLRGQLQQGAAGQALQYSQQPFQNQLALGQLGLGTQAYQPYIQKGQSGFIPGLAGSLASGFGQSLGRGLGGGFF
jgi:hypothetical protein